MVSHPQQCEQSGARSEERFPSHLSSFSRSTIIIQCVRQSAGDPHTHTRKERKVPLRERASPSSHTHRLTPVLLLLRGCSCWAIIRVIIITTITAQCTVDSKHTDTRSDWWCTEEHCFSFTTIIGTSGPALRRSRASRHAAWQHNQQ